jgi:solute:Na+ symporter, SSS family
MGGLYWKRATSAGAAASLCAGFGLQVGLILIDLIKTAPMAPPYLESFHPLLMGHGVIVAMTVSGFVFITVSLATEPSQHIRLVPFFSDEALAFAASIKGGLCSASPQELGVMDRIDVRRCGTTVRLHYAAEFSSEVDWQKLVAKLLIFCENWVRMAGAESIQRFGCGEFGEFFSCVTVTRGYSWSIVWFEAEGNAMHLQQLKQDICRAVTDTETVLESFRKQQL